MGLDKKVAQAVARANHTADRDAGIHIGQHLDATHIHCKQGHMSGVLLIRRHTIQRPSNPPLRPHQSVHVQYREKAKHLSHQQLLVLTKHALNVDQALLPDFATLLVWLHLVALGAVATTVVNQAAHSLGHKAAGEELAVCRQSGGIVAHGQGA